MVGAIYELVLDFPLREEVADKVASETGKRYVCAQCGAEFIVTKGGTGALTCCNQPMQLKR